MRRILEATIQNKRSRERPEENSDNLIEKIIVGRGKYYWKQGEWLWIGNNGKNI